MDNEAAASMKEITLDGHRIVYREAGRGEAVLLVHGWTGSSYDWTRLIPLLGEKHRVVAPDQLGFGKSDKPRINYTLDTFTGLLDELTSALGLERFHLVGNSMGGQISATYALLRPEKVKTLTLLDAAGVSEGSPLIFALARNPRLVYPLLRFAPLFAYGFYYRRFGPYFDSSFLTPRDVRGHYHSFGNPGGARAAALCLRNIICDQRARLDARLGEISTPTLVVWGANDPLLSIRMGKVFAREIPGAVLKIVDRCGHCAQEEKPVELAAMLEDFWKDHE